MDIAPDLRREARVRAGDFGLFTLRVLKCTTFAADVGLHCIYKRVLVYMRKAISEPTDGRFELSQKMCLLAVTFTLNLITSARRVPWI